MIPVMIMTLVVIPMMKVMKIVWSILKGIIFYK